MYFFLWNDLIIFKSSDSFKFDIIHQITNIDGSFICTFGSKGVEPGQFNEPYGVAFDQHGHLLVADSDNHRIQVNNYQNCTRFYSCIHHFSFTPRKQIQEKKEMKDFVYFFFQKIK